LFGSTVAVAFQSVFHLEMYQNNIFIFFKLFLKSAHQNNIKKYIYIYYFKIKKINFFLKYYLNIKKNITMSNKCDNVISNRRS
jgi:hypothetical protein